MGLIVKYIAVSFLVVHSLYGWCRGEDPVKKKLCAYINASDKDTSTISLKRFFEESYVAYFNSIGKDSIEKYHATVSVETDYLILNTRKDSCMVTFFLKVISDKEIFYESLNCPIVKKADEWMVLYECSQGAVVKEHKQKKYYYTNNLRQRKKRQHDASLDWISSRGFNVCGFDRKFILRAIGYKE